MNKWVWMAIIATASLIIGCQRAELQLDQIEETVIANRIPEEPALQGPIIRFTQIQDDMLEGTGGAVVSYEVITGDFEVESIQCLVDGREVECELNNGTLTIREPGLGNHTVQVIATDSSGLTDEGTTSFTVHDRFTRVKQPVGIAVEETRADVLFVIDNSGSMAQEQEGIANKISSLLESINHFSWRVAIATTDPTSGENYSDGRIVQFPNGRWFLDGSLDLATAKDQFSQTIQRKESGHYQERGIRAVYRSIERSKNPRAEVDRQLANFFRADASLSVVLVSDEDEDAFGHDDNYRSSGEELVNLVENTWGSDKIFQFHSIITRPGDDQCLRPNGDGFSYGKLYEELSRRTNGTVGDICASDYSSQLQLIGQEVAKLETIYNLDCKPQDIDRDGVPNFTVVPKNGNSVPSYRVEGSKVIFSRTLRPGDYDFVYFCLNTVS